MINFVGIISGIIGFLLIYSIGTAAKHKFKLKLNIYLSGLFASMIIYGILFLPLHTLSSGNFLIYSRIALWIPFIISSIYIIKNKLIVNIKEILFALSFVLIMLFILWVTNARSTFFWDFRLYGKWILEAGAGEPGNVSGYMYGLSSFYRFFGVFFGQFTSLENITYGKSNYEFATGVMFISIPTLIYSIKMFAKEQTNKYLSIFFIMMIIAKFPTPFYIGFSALYYSPIIGSSLLIVPFLYGSLILLGDKSKSIHTLSFMALGMAFYSSSWLILAAFIIMIKILNNDYKSKVLFVPLLITMINAWSDHKVLLAYALLTLTLIVVSLKQVKLPDFKKMARFIVVCAVLCIAFHLFMTTNYKSWTQWRLKNLSVLILVFLVASFINKRNYVWLIAIVIFLNPLAYMIFRKFANNVLDHRSGFIAIFPDRNESFFRILSITFWIWMVINEFKNARRKKVV